MKTLIFLLLAVLVNFNIFAATCSSISYTSNAANSTLTSTKYNTDNSTIYNFVNAYDAGCITAATLEKDALDATVATGFAVPLNGIVDGCKVTQATAATLEIGNCIASVNNNWVKTATTTTVAWTDLDTGSEAASTYYYVYIDSTSSGSTLTPVISTTAPGTDGLNGSDRVLAKFYNNASSDIIDTVNQWNVNNFVKEAVVAKYDTDAGQSIANGSDVIINFDSNVDSGFAFDDYDLVTVGASWVFTAKTAGIYEISSAVQLEAAAWDAGETGYLSFWKNSTRFARFLYEVPASGTFIIVYSGLATIKLAEGDTLHATLYQGSGSAIALYTADEYNWISIKKLP